jgi:hypothetical protein
LLSDAALVRAALGDDGSSYCVPLVIAYRDGCTDLQLGLKWGPGDIAERVLAACASSAQMVFLRWHDSGADVDEIFEVGPNITQWRRWCRYAFDALAIERRGLPGFAVTEISGTYLAGNNRFAADVPPLTPMTPAGSASKPLHIAPADVAAKVARLTHDDEIKKIEWRFAGRAVHVEHRFRGGRPSNFGLDDWDNCADSGYLLARDRDPVVDEELERADEQRRAEFLKASMPSRRT